MKKNDKLKAEIEKLIEYIENQKKLYEYRIDLQLKYSDRNHEEIEQLKSELEQSIKLPCKVGDTVYVAYSVKGRKPVISENKFTLKYYADNINYFGRTIFLTREEAEQHLEDKQLKARIDADNVKKDFKEFCNNRDREEGKLKFREVE